MFQKFRILVHSIFGFVSDFAFRASDFLFILINLMRFYVIIFIRFGYYLSLSVLIASSARAMAIIQNLTITFGSGQPFSSK